jgi:hypothetical protein
VGRTSHEVLCNHLLCVTIYGIISHAVTAHRITFRCPFLGATSELMGISVSIRSGVNHVDFGFKTAGAQTGRLQPVARDTRFLALNLPDSTRVPVSISPVIILGDMYQPLEVLRFVSTMRLHVCCGVPSSNRKMCVTWCLKSIGHTGWDPQD